MGAHSSTPEDRDVALGKFVAAVVFPVYLNLWHWQKSHSWDSGEAFRKTLWQIKALESTDIAKYKEYN